MKMITAIINRNDADVVCDALRYEGFTFTKMASTGGFLRSGNITVLLGIDDEKVPLAMEIIRRNCERRNIPMPTPVMGDGIAPGFYTPPAVVPVGGATVFVTNIEQFEKM